jgi:hypothetical protein
MYRFYKDSTRLNHYYSQIYLYPTFKNKMFKIAKKIVESFSSVFPQLSFEPTFEEIEAHFSKILYEKYSTYWQNVSPWVRPTNSAVYVKIKLYF